MAGLAWPGLGAARPLGARRVLKTQRGSLARPDLEGLSPQSPRLAQHDHHGSRGPRSWSWRPEMAVHVLLQQPPSHVGLA